MKGAVLGGVVGAVVVAAKSMQSDEPNDVVASKVARTAGGAAVAGAWSGFVLDGRARRRRARKRPAAAGADRRRAPGDGGQGGRGSPSPTSSRPRSAPATPPLRAAEAARPQLEHAAEVARGQARSGVARRRRRPAELAELAERLDAPHPRPGPVAP